MALIRRRIRRILQNAADNTFSFQIPLIFLYIINLNTHDHGISKEYLTDLSDIMFITRDINISTSERSEWVLILISQVINMISRKISQILLLFHDYGPLINCSDLMTLYVWVIKD